jgi:hypothetical protein
MASLQRRGCPGALVISWQMPMVLLDVDLSLLRCVCTANRVLWLHVCSTVFVLCEHQTGVVTDSMVCYMQRFA